MPWGELIAKAVARTRKLPVAARYAATLAIVVAALLFWRAARSALPEDYPFLPFFTAVMLCAALFDRGSGLVATAASAVLVAYFYLHPIGSLRVDDRYAVALGFFVATAVVTTLVIESLHMAVERLGSQERARALLLHEFRHRTRNDLNSLAGLLLVRARSVPSAVAREHLREAAEHTRAIARIHSRLAPWDESGVQHAATAETREFVTGICADIEAGQKGGGLRPVAVVAEAEAHTLPSDRAVPFGLVLNEVVTSALRHAFPDGGGGTVRVRFAREGGDFLLTVADDGIGLPEDGELDRAPPGALPDGAGLGTRLLRALAAQLRGSFSRVPGPGGTGTVATLRFPVEVSGR